MNIKVILKYPLLYQLFQVAGGFFGARMKAINAYLPIKRGEKVLDIGCGPGFIVQQLPSDIIYIGFDTDLKYISYAVTHFGNKGNFVCCRFDDHTAQQYVPADIVMANGLLHHLSDNEAHETLGVIKRALGPGGRLFTLDGCFVEGQSVLARYLLNHDRGQYVRTKERYHALMAKHFDSVETHISHSLSWFPYSWIVMIAHNQ